MHVHCCVRENHLDLFKERINLDNMSYFSDFASSYKNVRMSLR